MKSRRTQIIFTLATIILVVGFVLVPTVKAFVSADSGASGAVSAAAGAATGNQAQVAAGTEMATAVADQSTKDKSPCSIFNMSGCINAALTFFINNVILAVANWFLTLMGVILNGVMIMTLNMSSFVGASGGVVDATWSVIRDLSSIMIIFFLLYTSIEIIIQKTDSKVQHMIIMVVVAGVLLNFSLFFTKVAVDASNLVGLAFYRAIAPSGANINFNQPGSNYISNAFTSGGISNEFMAALKIQSAAYNPNSTTFSTSSAINIPNTNPLAIIISGLLGAAMMIIAGLSFLAASILFAVRIALLIILMAFSPVYFVGMIIPAVKKKLSDRWWNMLINQCLILPIYMLFVYVALRVITNPSFQSALNPSGATGGTALFSVSIVGTIMEYIIGLILIIIPLIAAMEYASVGKDLANAIVDKGKKWSKSAISGTASFAGRNTFGAAATAAGESNAFKNFAKNNPNAGRLLSSSFAKVGSGYEKARKATEKKNKGVFEQIGKVDRAKFQEGPEGDRLYEEAKKTRRIEQAEYLENLRKSSVFAVVSGSSNKENRSSSYGMAGGKEGKKLRENLEKDVQGIYSDKKNAETLDYLTTPNVPPPIEGTNEKANQAVKLERQINTLNQRIKGLAQYKPGEKEEEEMAEKIKRDLKEEMESGGGGKKGGGSKKSEGSDDSAKEKLSGDKP